MQVILCGCRYVGREGIAGEGGGAHWPRPPRGSKLVLTASGYEPSAGWPKSDTLVPAGARHCDGAGHTSCCRSSEDGIRDDREHGDRSARKHVCVIHAGDEQVGVVGLSLPCISVCSRLLDTLASSTQHSGTHQGPF